MSSFGEMDHRKKEEEGGKHKKSRADIISSTTTGTSTSVLQINGVFETSMPIPIPLINTTNNSHINANSCNSNQYTDNTYGGSGNGGGYTISPRSAGGSSSAVKLLRGRYKCSLCGVLKVNHE